MTYVKRSYYLRRVVAADSTRSAGSRPLQRRLPEPESRSRRSPARASAVRTLAAYSPHGLGTFIAGSFLGGRTDRAHGAERPARGRSPRFRPGRAGDGGARG